ncbi:MFS transporter [Streptomyces sulphureus]|uniref:MFS transporter n=1 Tax=Streptomyces sulphureus TaxID=47758 RepID=UPI00036BA334|nr:MFS transporter [Streptomyces sulphureus]
MATTRPQSPAAESDVRPPAGQGVPQGADAGGGGAKHAQGARSASGDAPRMTHRQIMEAFSGLLLAMFVAILSSTIVANAMPRIVSDLGGGQSSYTWVVTASLLTMTATTPLWGKLADLTSKKILIQTAIVIFVLASASAGLAQNPGMLIASRAVQGIGMGGITALVQIVIGALISPRERGKYMGYIGAVFAVSTVGGPLLGGVITDADFLGWRWCFYAGIPFAVIALVTLQKTLKLPVVKRDVKVDWFGAFLVAAAVSLLLIWVTFAGDKYDWASWQTYTMVGGSLVLGLLFVLVESKVREPIMPLRLFRNSTITLTSLASLFVGIAMFGATVYLSQYFQLAKGKSPTMAGVMTIPMITGLFLSTTISGRVISHTGRWKVWLCSGGVLMTAALGLLGSLRADTEYWHMAIFMGLLGLGVGSMMQNLVLATQNQVDPNDLGAASSMVNFFRSLGGAVGVSALGAVLSHRITHYVEEGMAKLGIDNAGGATGGNGSAIPNLDELPGPIRGVIENAYGHGIGDVYLYAAPLAFVALLLVLFVKEVPLKTKSALEQDATGDAEPLSEEVEQPVPAAVAAETAPVQAAAAPSGLASTATLPTTAEATMPGIAIQGTVRTGDGTGIAGAAVTLISPSGRQLGRATAHGDGTYRLDAPEAGAYVLIAAADGHQPQASTVTVGEQPLGHDLLLSGTSGLAGVVRDAGEKTPLAEATVVVTDARGEVVASGQTGAEGQFRFDELVGSGGESTVPVFTVAVNAPGFRPTATPVEVHGQGVTRMEVELSAGAQVQGTVRAGTDRRPLGDARVTLVDAAGNVVGTSTTGADGAYAFTDLDAGEYTVIASGYPPVANALLVQGQGVEGYDVELHHPDE